MVPFTPFPALFGGALVGLSAALLLLADGRIAGISGIAGRMIARPDKDTPWRAAFLVGLLAGTPVFAALSGHWPPVRILASWPVLAVAGLLVGFGTRLGSGCTSGHGVCGLARLSPRSMASVAVFMAVAVATVFLVRHVIPGGWA
jgi:uncharacterized membrane protein YedE/YeeE